MRILLLAASLAGSIPVRLRDTSQASTNTTLPDCSTQYDTQPAKGPRTADLVSHAFSRLPTSHLVLTIDYSEEERAPSHVRSSRLRISSNLPRSTLTQSGNRLRSAVPLRPYPCKSAEQGREHFLPSEQTRERTVQIRIQSSRRFHRPPP